MKAHGPGAVKFYSKVTNGTIGNTELVFPTLIISKGMKRKFGGIEVEFIFSNNGHSPGDILLWLPKQKIIFGGDVLSSQWMPIITGHGNVLTLIDTLNKVEKFQPAIVLTGHGKSTTSESVIRDAALLSSVWKQVEVGHEQAQSIEKILSVVKAKYSDKYNPLYQDFEPEIERHVKLMFKLLSKYNPSI